jgi:uncharacterized protein YecE (DUF72 family)
MIRVGLTGWGDHDSLYDASTRQHKLVQYSSCFPVVEIDSSFYAVQPQRNYEKWVKETPDSFSFVVKTYQGITGHLRSRSPFDTNADMFKAFKESIQPLITARKLKVVLFQYPPWFECNKENVSVLRAARELIGDIPAALEFRHQSWFHPAYRERTLEFMKQERWIHSICDEPQVGDGSIPMVLEPTDENITIVRFHGRNVKGWIRNGKNRENWREVRYLYRYNKKELTEWKHRLLDLKKNTNDIYVLFNNNSGGDAAYNAQQLIEILGIEYNGLGPKQMSLF